VKGIYGNLLKDLNLKAEEVSLLAGGLVPADQQGACANMNKIIEELPRVNKLRPGVERPLRHCISRSQSR
jgi:hypothetical protein